MVKKRVHELARELGISSKILIERAQALGYTSVRAAANTLEEREATELAQKLSQANAQAQPRPAKTVLRRRATRTQDDENIDAAYEVVTTRLSEEGAQVIDRKQIDMPAPALSWSPTQVSETDMVATEANYPVRVGDVEAEKTQPFSSDRESSPEVSVSSSTGPEIVTEKAYVSVSTEVVSKQIVEEPGFTKQEEVPTLSDPSKNKERVLVTEQSPEPSIKKTLSEAPTNTNQPELQTATTTETISAPEVTTPPDATTGDSVQNATASVTTPTPVIENTKPSAPTTPSQTYPRPVIRAGTQPVGTVPSARRDAPPQRRTPEGGQPERSQTRSEHQPSDRERGDHRERNFDRNRPGERRHEGQQDRPGNNRAEGRPESRPGDRQDSRPGDRQDSRPGDRPGYRPENRSGDRPGGYRQDSRPGDRQDSRPGDRQDSRPGDRQDSRPGDRQDSRPGDRPGYRPGGDRPEGRSGDRPGYRPGDRPESRPGDRPESRPGDRPGGYRPESRPGDRPGGYRPESRPGDRPESRPGDRPGGYRPSSDARPGTSSRPQDRPRGPSDSFGGGGSRWKEPEIPVDFLEDGKIRRKREKGRRSNEYVQPEETDDGRQMDRRRTASGQPRDMRRSAKGKDKKKQGEPQAITAPLSERKRVIKIDGDITVAELAHRMGIRAAELIGALLRQGVMARINDVLSVEQAAELALLKDYRIEDTSIGVEDILQPTDQEEDPALLEFRPPVVTVMGHVDHGKTSLLDAIRETRVASQEAGGITQHVGASVVTLKGGRDIVFLDTPGHEAFTAMRSRGAKSTDIVVLVVAADDSVMPQTIEAINHAKAAGVPIVVAVNKIDKPGAEPLRVRTDLMQHGLISEDFGGEHLMVNVSAHTKQGIPELLESVLLQAEMMELKANPNRLAQGVVIESRIEKGRGPVATLLVQSGTIHTGDSVVAGTYFGRIRAMFDHSNALVSSMVPPYPVQILGLSGTPAPGDTFNCLEDERAARQVAELRMEVLKKQENVGTQRARLQDLWGEEQKKELNIILKTDVEGTLEALRQSLLKLKNSEIQLAITHSGVGGITENDINLASTTGSVVFGFNVRADNKAQKLAEAEGIEIRIYQVIYELIDDVKAAMERQLAPTLQEKPTGQAEIRKIFAIPKIGKVAGCYVTDGKITRGSLIRLYRNNIRIYEGKVATLRRFKNDVKEVASGYECGIQVDGYQDIHENDMIEAYEIEEIATKLELDA